MEPSIIEIIDTKINETIHTNFFGALVSFLTHDDDLARKVEQAVHTGARIVMLYDRYMEIGDERYLEASQLARRELSLLHPNLSEHSVDDMYNKTIGPFWEYEQSLLEKAPFTISDREHYSMMKSSDVPFYLSIAELFVPIDDKYKSAFRALQRINDIYDDLIDISEDRAEGSPNIILLFSLDYTSPDDLFPSERTELLDRINPLFNEVIACTELPFLGQMAKQYRADIERILC